MSPDWIEDSQKAGYPKFGDIISCGDNGRNYTGRFVFAWNNMVRLVLDDGTYKVFGWPSPPYNQHQLSQRIEIARGAIAKFEAEIQELKSAIRALVPENRDSKEIE